MNCHQSRVMGFTMIELLISLAIVGSVMAGTYSSFRSFSQASRASIGETAVLEDVTQAMDVFRDDIEVSGWGLPSVSRVASDNAGGEQLDEANYGVDINGDGDASDTITTDRVFVSDGMKILADSGSDESHGYFQDAAVTSHILLRVADAAEDDGQKALLTGQSTGGVSVSTTNVNSGSENSEYWYRGSTYSCADIRDTTALIFGGETSAGSYAIEGHRISSVSPAGTAQCGTTSAAANVTFISGETVANTYVTNDSSVAVPAIAWYIDQKDTDDTTWLYRNEKKVLPNVVDFQLAYGLDPDMDGMEWSGDVWPGTAATLRSRPEHFLPYLPSDDVAYATRSAATNGEAGNYIGKPRHLLESLRAVWARVTVLRRVASEEDAEDNIVATTYVALVSLRN